MQNYDSLVPKAFNMSFRASVLPLQAGPVYILSQNSTTTVPTNALVLNGARPSEGTVLTTES